MIEICSYDSYYYGTRKWYMMEHTKGGGEMVILLFTAAGGEIDFGQCMCCHENWHPKINMGIREAKKKLSSDKPVIFCGSNSDDNPIVDRSFSQMHEQEVVSVKQAVIAEAQKVKKAYEHERIARKLLASHRYADLRELCQINDLSYDSIVGNR